MVKVRWQCHTSIWAGMQLYPCCKKTIYKNMIGILRFVIVTGNMILSVVGMAIVIMAIMLNSWNQKLLAVDSNDTYIEISDNFTSSDFEPQPEMSLEDGFKEDPLTTPVILCIAAGIATTIGSALGYWGACCQMPVVMLIHSILLAPTNITVLVAGISLVIMKDPSWKDKNYHTDSPCTTCEKYSNSIDQVSRPLAALVLIVGAIQLHLFSLAIFYILCIRKKQAAQDRRSMLLTGIDSTKLAGKAEAHETSTLPHNSADTSIIRNREGRCDSTPPTPPKQFVFKRYLTPQQLESAPLVSIPRVRVTLSTPPVSEDLNQEVEFRNKVISAPPPPPPPSTPIAATALSRPTVPSFTFDTPTISRLQKSA